MSISLSEIFRMGSEAEVEEDNPRWIYQACELVSSSKSLEPLSEVCVLMNLVTRLQIFFQLGC